MRQRQNREASSSANSTIHYTLPRMAPSIRLCACCGVSFTASAVLESNSNTDRALAGLISGSAGSTCLTFAAFTTITSFASGGVNTASFAPSAANFAFNAATLSTEYNR